MLLRSNKPPLTLKQSYDSIAQQCSGRDPVEIFTAVHRWVLSNIDYAEDKAVYGVTQRTASVSETLQRRLADCEDFAFLMYTLCRALGIPQEDMSIRTCYVWDSALHCVLVYNPQELVADNQLKQIKPLARRLDLSRFRTLAMGSFPQDGQADPGLRYA